LRRIRDEITGGQDGTTTTSPTTLQGWRVGVSLVLGVLEMAKWKMLHQEQPSGDITIESWHNPDNNALLFVRNNQGQSYAVYQTIEDSAGNNTDFALAEVCYGWYNFLWESYGGKSPDAHDDFLDDCWVRSERFVSVEDQFICHDSPLACADAFHAIQVDLGNEECAGCDVCAEYFKEKS
jgi:hypothetical protein